MQSQFDCGRFFSGRYRRLNGIFFVAGIFCWAVSAQTWAAVFAVGDVTPQQTFTGIVIGGQMVDITAPNLPSGGGRVTDDATPTGTDVDLIVGGTGVFSGNITFNIGTTIGEVTINNPTGTLPLIAPNVTIGMTSNGKGRINLNDFGTTLVAETLLTVGDEGEGELRLTNGARVGVGIFNIDPLVLKYEGGTMVVGSQRDTAGANQFLSEGIVTIDGFGSVLETEDLIVADEGLGTIEISGKANLLTFDTTLGESVGSTGRVTLAGLNTRWTNTDDLIVGNNGSGLLEVNDFAVVVSDTITVGTTSFVNLDGGTLISNTSIVNNGVIRGAGRIESDVTIGSEGELRNAAGAASLREYLLVTGAVTNAGLIESQGGELEFQGAVVNDSNIVARDAVMRFNDGLTNSFSLTVGGDTTIYGPVMNVGDGDVHVLSNSETLLVGDLTFSASSTLVLSIGDSPGTLDVLGMTNLGGAMLELDYSAGVGAQEGDTYQILTSGDGLTGMFSNPIGGMNSLPQVGAGGLIWDIDVQAGAVFVTATAMTVAPTLGDFDLDDDVDGFDFLAWQRGFPGTFGAGDLADWEMNFGTTAGPLVAATGAIPEPTSIAMLLLGSVLIAGRRSRRVS